MRGWRYGCMVVGIVGMALVVGMCGKKDEGPNEPDYSNVWADIIFITDPPGAVVYLDRDSVGVTRPSEEAPLRVEDVPGGNHEYRILLQGYKPVKRDILVANSNVKRVDLALEKLSGIYIETDPAGAAVYMDLRGFYEVQGKTPFTLENVESGIYRVRVDLDGYVSQAATLDVKAGQGAFATFDLVREPQIEKVEFRAVDRKEGTYKDPATRFAYSLFTGESNYRIECLITFAEPAEGDCMLVGDLLREGVSADRRYIEVYQGETEASSFWQVEEPGVTFMREGNYALQVFNGEKLLAEASFEVVR